MATKTIGGVELSGGSVSRVILFKFNSPNASVIPVGAPLVERPLNGAMQARQAQQGVRPGVKVIDNLPSVAVSPEILGQLASLDFVLAGVHGLSLDRASGTQYVANFAFERQAALDHRLAQATPKEHAEMLANIELAKRSFAERAASTWQFCHVYDNPPPRADTVELIDTRGYSDAAKKKPPRHTIVLTDGPFLTACQAPTSV
ncbi:MAG: hypothetical protein HY455_02695 [Parcubacteria group bacterium]|nr:hypothetical protein [Parcubacteria group bacterium]